MTAVTLHRCANDLSLRRVLDGRWGKSVVAGISECHRSRFTSNQLPPLYRERIRHRVWGSIVSPSNGRIKCLHAKHRLPKHPMRWHYSEINQLHSRFASESTTLASRWGVGNDFRVPKGGVATPIIITFLESEWGRRCACMKPPEPLKSTCHSEQSAGLSP